MKYLKTFFLILFSFSAYSEEPAYKDWSDDIICDKAWYGANWTNDPDLLVFVQEAKERNLVCNPLGDIDKKEQTLIDNCIEGKQKIFDRGITDETNYSISKINYCLENVIIELTNNVTNQTIEETSKQLISLRNGLLPLVSSHWNGHKSCTPACGTMFTSFPGNFYTQILKNIIAEMIESDALREF